MSMNSVSPLCLTTSVRMKFLKPQAFQVDTVKGKASLTGGSWKKSPLKINWIQPNGLSLFLIFLAICSSFAKRPAGSMLTSSRMRTLTSSQRFRVIWLVLLPLCMPATSLSTVSAPNPIPAQLWMVQPLGRLVAATPVGAVTTIDEKSGSEFGGS